MEAMRRIRSSALCLKEEQLLALQLQFLKNNEVSQEGHGFPHDYYEDYKIRKSTYFEACNVPRVPLHNIPPPPWIGRVVSMAMDPCDCQYLQATIEECNPIYVELILSEVKDYLHMLMTHRFGNQLIQMIFEARAKFTWQQIDFIVLLIISSDQKLRDVCMDNYGTRVIQIMLENITSPFMKFMVVNTMKRITVALMKNLNGGHVILQCVKVFPPELQKIILDEVARNCVDIVTDKIGCSVVQKCFDYSGRIATYELVSEIILNSMLLAENPLGNYVVQYIIKREFPVANELMIENLRGNFVRLSMNKYSSNVMEDLLRYSHQNNVDIIVEEMISSRNILNVLKDPYGNFVAQRALELTQGRLRRKLSYLIRSYRMELLTHPYGKNVLLKAISYTQ